MSAPCSRCGYCPHCGRGAKPWSPYVQPQTPFTWPVPYQFQQPQTYPHAVKTTFTVKGVQS